MSCCTLGARAQQSAVFSQIAATRYDSAREDESFVMAFDITSARIMTAIEFRIHARCRTSRKSQMRYLPCVIYNWIFRKRKFCLLISFFLEK